MSRTTVLAVAPDRRPIELAVFDNAWGWSPSIWERLVQHRTGEPVRGLVPDLMLNALWRAIEELPPWQQVPLVLTFDTGVIPGEEVRWAADRLDEFEERLPAEEGHVNHVPAMAELLRSDPEAPLVGVWGTSVTENPFDPWDEEADDYGSGIPLAEMYVLERHRPQVLQVTSR